jgi:hypothetical protein
VAVAFLGAAVLLALAFGFGLGARAAGAAVSAALVSVASSVVTGALSGTGAGGSMTIGAGSAVG